MGAGAFSTGEELSEWLQWHGAETQDWGTGNAKTVKNLLSEIEDHESGD